MVIPDEFRYAKISREIVETGNWVVPHLDGLRYFEKTAIGHWLLNAMAITLFGENTFAVRFPSAVAVGLSVLMLFFLVRMFADTYYASILTPVIFLTGFEVFGVGTFTVLDSIFSMVVTASMAAYRSLQNGPIFASRRLQPLYNSTTRYLQIRKNVRFVSSVTPRHYR